MAVLPLPAASLRRPSTLAEVPFTTTDDLEGLPQAWGAPGQDRAREAIDFGVGLRAPGYNLFVLGPPGVGKRTLVLDLVAQRAAVEQPPSDWCYVNNFAQPYRPRALKFPRGQGAGFRKEVRQFREEVRASIPALFESDEYRNRAEQIDTEVSERQHDAFATLGRDARAQGIALIQTPVGFSLAPVVGEEVMTPEQFQQLPADEKGRLEAAIKALQERLQKAIRQVQQLQKDKRDRIKELGREMCQVTVAALIDDLRADCAPLPEVVTYLDEMQADVLENLDEFRRTSEEPNPLGLRLDDTFFTRYDVNVVIGDEGTGDGAPVVVEDNPTYTNLLGRVEYVARFGTLATDFNQIKAGALHRANGGYLLLDAQRLLSQPFAWDGLKRSLRTREIRTEPLGQAYSLMATAALEPEPIPLDVKVVLFGDRLLYYLLVSHDPEFAELFRVPADFEDEVERTPDHEALYARLIATIARREGWLPLERDAVARVIEQATRWAGDAQRISAELEDLTDLLRESDHRARQERSATVTAAHVEGSIEARRRRSGRIRERVHDAIRRGDLHIATSGSVVGQVNGLSVTLSADQPFAFPTRITANTRMGDAGVVDIQREVALSGPIHSKGVLILASLLATRYSPDRPPSVSASLVFEQTYGPVDGDSASVAELCALLSSLGGFGLDQGFAVTGAVDQHGRVLPIGAVNEKIEGFFDVCAARGLTGSQGVVIPATNVRHLMLRPDVVDAVARGEFQVYPAESLDDALGVLSGLDPSEADARVKARLADLSTKRLEYLRRAAELERGSEPAAPGAAPETGLPPEPGQPPEPISPPAPPPEATP